MRQAAKLSSLVKALSRKYVLVSARVLFRGVQYRLALSRIHFYIFLVHSKQMQILNNEVKQISDNSSLYTYSTSLQKTLVFSLTHSQQ